MIENNIDTEANMKIKAIRRYDIDALRVYAVILLIIFHTAMLFASGTPYYIQNGDLSVEMLIFVFIINIFHMSLFFFLAGMSTSYSLDTKIKEN